MKSVSILVSIDERLRFTLFGLRCVLDVNLSGEQIEQIYSDAQADQVSAKLYVLYSNHSVRVVVRVDVYEPETAHIEVQSKIVSQERLERIYEDAQYEVFCRERACS